MELLCLDHQVTTIQELQKKPAMLAIEDGQVKNSKKKDDYDLDMELLMPLIVQTTSLEKFNLTGTNFSTNVVNILLKVLGSCETLRCLKIINVPESSKVDDKSFLEPLNCCNLQQLQLVGFSPFVSKRTLFDL